MTDLNPADPNAAAWLLCRAGPHLPALPLAAVGEVMRVLPIEPLSAGALSDTAALPDHVLGVSIIRGAPLPVIHAGILLGAGNGRPHRLVTIAVGARQVALAVDGVIGIRRIAAAAMGELPPLLRGVAGDRVAAIGALDLDLLVVLQTARLVPDALLAALGGPDAAAREAPVREAAP